MSAEENKAIVRRLLEETWNKRNLAVIDELLAAEWVNHSAPPGTPPGREAGKTFFATVLAAAEDWQISIEDMVAEGDRVVIRFTNTFLHTGKLMGMAPTGKRITETGITIVRIEGGGRINARRGWPARDVQRAAKSSGSITSIADTRRRSRSLVRNAEAPCSMHAATCRASAGRSREAARSSAARRAVARSSATTVRFG